MQRLGSSCTNGYPVEEVNWGRVISEVETEVEYEVVATLISGKNYVSFCRSDPWAKFPWPKNR